MEAREEKHKETKQTHLQRRQHHGNQEVFNAQGGLRLRGQRREGRARPRNGVSPFASGGEGGGKHSTRSKEEFPERGTEGGEGQEGGQVRCEAVTHTAGVCAKSTKEERAQLGKERSGCAT